MATYAEITERLADRYAGISADLFDRISANPGEPLLKGVSNAPQNISGHVYVGNVNILALQMRQKLEGWELPLWMTPLQAKDMGVNFAGAQTTPVYMVERTYRHIPENSEVFVDTSSQTAVWAGRLTRAEMRLLRERGSLRSFTDADLDTMVAPSERKDFRKEARINVHNLLNVCQTTFRETYPSLYEEAAVTLAESTRGVDGHCIDDCVNLGEWPCRIVFGDRWPAYSAPMNFPDPDTILMRPKETYHSASEYYSTLARLMARSLLLGGRMPKEVSERYLAGTFEATALTELATELSAALICSFTGVQSTVSADNLKYLKHWTELAGRDRSMVFSVMKDAGAVVNCALQNMEFAEMEGVNLEAMTYEFNPSLLDTAHERRMQKEAIRKSRRNRRGH